MQPLTGSYVYGVNARSENFLLLVTFSFRVRKVYKKLIKRVVISGVLDCVINFMIC